MVRRLDAKGAGLRVLAPEISTFEEAGRAFVEALAAVDRLCAADDEPPARARTVQVWDVQALRAQGFGPSQIARKLGVSRMTVWRKLNEREAVGLSR
ncbi:MAG: helix-turn-helix domain-containing protein [Caulobacteraceae bacterium]